MNDIPQKYRNQMYCLIDYMSELNILELCYDVEKQQYTFRMKNDEICKLSATFVNEYLRLKNY